MHERVGDLEKNNHGVKDRAYTKNQSLNHATAERERDSVMHTCYTRMMQNRGLSSRYLFVCLACEPLIHGVLCLSLSVSSRGNIGSQNHRRDGRWKLWSKIEINIKINK